MIRRGVTLVEVLVAIFLMGLGLIAIMTLFPLGALQMGQALKDDRCAQAVMSADAIARVEWRKMWINPATGGPRTFEEAAQLEPMLFCMDNPAFTTYNPAAPPGTSKLLPPSTSIGYPAYPNPGYTPDTILRPSDIDLQGFPIFVDPIGFDTQPPVGPGGRNWQRFVGGTSGAAGNPLTSPSGLPRVTLRDVNNITNPQLKLAAKMRLCALSDDMTFSENGLAVDGANIERGYAFNWAWMLRRNRGVGHSDSKLTIIVYHKRPVDIAAWESTYPAELNPGQRNVRMFYSSIDPNGAPGVKKGGWILDNSADIRNHAHFYRVIAITPVEGPLTPMNIGGTVYDRALDLEVQVPIRGPNANPSNGGRITVMDLVAEVFERDDLKID